MMLVNISATSEIWKFLWKFLIAHQLIAISMVTAIAYWSFSAYASVLKPPPPMSSICSQWWYAVVHLAAANLDKLKGKS
jgi:hypothetical protein